MHGASGELTTDRLRKPKVLQRDGGRIIVMGPQSNLKIQKEWCRYWIRSHYGFEQRSALILLLSVDRSIRQETSGEEAGHESSIKVTHKFAASLDKILQDLRWQFAQPVFVNLKIAANSRPVFPETISAMDEALEMPTRYLSALDHSESVGCASDLCAWVCAADSLIMVQQPEFAGASIAFEWCKPIAELAYGFGKPFNKLDLGTAGRWVHPSQGEVVQKVDSPPLAPELNWERLHQSNRETLAIALGTSEFHSSSQPGLWTYKQGLERLEIAWRDASEATLEPVEHVGERRKVA